MVKIADELAHATELVRTFAGDDWDRTMASVDRDALVWLLEIAGGQHAYIRSQAFRDVVAAAYQMGRQQGLVECVVGETGVVGKQSSTLRALYEGPDGVDDRGRLTAMGTRRNGA